MHGYTSILLHIFPAKNMQTELLKAIQRLSEDGILSLERGTCIDEYLTTQKPKEQSQKSPNVLKHQLEKSFLTPPTSFSLEWLDKLQEYVPSLSSIGSRLTLGAGDGISTLILPGFMNLRRPKPGLSFVSPEMVWTAKFRAIEKSLSLQTPRPLKTQHLSYESPLIGRILSVELPAFSPLYQLDLMLYKKLHLSRTRCSLKASRIAWSKSL